MDKQCAIKRRTLWSLLLLCFIHTGVFRQNFISQQGPSPWRCWRTWSPARFTSWRFQHPTTWAMVRFLTRWSWQYEKVSPLVMISGFLVAPQVSETNMMSYSVKLSFLKRSHDNLTMFPRPIAFSDNFYHLDQKSMAGISVGVCIALICIIICAFIIICRGKNRYLVSLSVVTISHINSIHFYLYRAKSQQQLSQDIEVSSLNTSLCVLSGNFLLWKHAEREWAHLLHLQDLHPLKEKLSMLMWACQWWIKTIFLMQRYSMSYSWH